MKKTVFGQFAFRSIHNMKCKFLLPLISILFFSCGDASLDVQKPRGYFKVNFPEKKYLKFDRSDFPFSFEYPVYGQVIQDTLFFDEKAENPYWLNIDFPQFGGRVHLSYKDVRSHNFDSLVNDAFTLSYKQHTYKASAIESQRFETLHHVSGIYFTLKGNAATANQFFATDSVKNFLRGALYFAATPNADSLQPVNDFLKQDVRHLIETLQWRQNR